jgi:3-methyl-2-oxobutanoate hydroxymethyltransferase
MLGPFEWTPKFVRRYGDMRDLAVEAYATDVKGGSFPGSADLYTWAK